MKILRKDVKHGRITVVPEMLDDLWVLYNIIIQGDTVYAKTTREIKLGERYARPEKGKRISVLLGVKVTSVSWDRNLNRLRVHGIVCDAPDEIGAKGSRHTLNVTLNRQLTIVKDRWIKHQLDRLDKSTKTGVSPIIVLSIDDETYCVAVVRQFNIDTKAEEAARIPGKRDVEARTKAFREFFKSALDAILEASTIAYPIVILGVGFTKTSFVKYLKERSPDISNRIIDVKSVNSSGSAGISEALRSGVLSKSLRDLRISEETKAVEEVLLRLGRETGEVAYGISEVKEATTFGAVETLLITDATLRESPDEDRVGIENLLRTTEERGGRVIVVSTEHEAGMKLGSLGGIAALLRFRIR
ncbi:MAG: mRNA surveillance protein pelota [Candidatus Bathyarchaeota archaeon]|nr:mRNA surveillance protein pelota [Candidatus Bathyarchaeota archaeon]